MWCLSESQGNRWWLGRHTIWKLRVFSHFIIVLCVSFRLVSNNPQQSQTEKVTLGFPCSFGVVIINEHESQATQHSINTKFKTVPSINVIFCSTVWMCSGLLNSTRNELKHSSMVLCLAMWRKSLKGFHVLHKSCNAGKLVLNSTGIYKCVYNNLLYIFVRFKYLTVRL